MRLLFIRSVNEVLDKDAKVHEEGNKASGQPAKVDQDISSINASSLAVLALMCTALRLVREDGQDVCDVSKASEQEKQHTQPVGGLASVVQDELRETRGNVCHHAEVAKNLADGVEFKRLMAILGWLLVIALGLLTEEPAQHPSGADHNHHSGIPQKGL